MNCDEAFDRLTADQPDGPQTDLERHLAACPRCRSMAELLAPAVDLLREAAEHGDAASLPARGRARQAAAPRTTAAPWERRRAPRAAWASLAAAAVAGFVVAWSIQASPDDPHRGVRGMARREGDPMDRDVDGAELVESLGLVSACLSGSLLPHDASPSGQAATALATLTLRDLDCCSQCHHWGTGGAAAAGIGAKVASSCQMCHLD